MKDNLESTPELVSICVGLSKWKQIVTYLNIIDYKNNCNFYYKRRKFDENARTFYAAGKTIFSTKDNNEEGDCETFCCHTLRFYIPQIAEITWKKHKLGVGIFSMQGFEWRNKESKNTLHWFTNKHDNVCKQNMKRLWDIFFYETTTV